MCRTVRKIGGKEKKAKCSKRQKLTAHTDLEERERKLMWAMRRNGGTEGQRDR